MVTQTTYSDYFWENRQFQKIEDHPCTETDSSVDTFSNQLIKSVITVSNDPDNSRPIAPDNLMFNPTDSLIQTTTTSVAGYKIYDQDLNYFCYPGPISGSYNSKTYVYNQPFPNYFAMVADPFWHSRLRTKIKELKVNLGASLAEYRQTVDLFLQLGTMLIGIKRSLLRGDIKGLARATNIRNIAAANLTYRFGILPLLSDVHKSLEALQSPPRDPQVIVRTQVKDKASAFGYDGYKHEHTSEVQIDAVAAVSFHHSALGKFTIGNPAELAWEITPFSWIIDYFFTLGEFLSVIDALEGVKDMRGSFTTRRKDVVKGPYLSPTSPAFIKQESVAHVTRETHKRETFTLGQINPDPIRWEPSLSFIRVGNLLSLAAILR